MHYLALHSVIPVRAEAREGAEQETQMLFAETCTLLEQQERWLRIRTDMDGQEGWVDRKMLTPMAAAEYRAYRPQWEKAALVAMPMAYAVSENNGQTIPLSAGTRLPNYQEGRFEVLGVGFRIDAGMVLTEVLPLDEAHLMQAVRFFLNIPYLWGGRNAMGMDCSGFSQTILSLFGKTLRRNAREQAEQGRAVASLAKAKAGDLVFFDHPASQDQLSLFARQPEQERHISHVGILLDRERVIHCSGRVKVERIDDQGILSMEMADKKHPKGVYTHRLVTIRRA